MTVPSVLACVPAYNSAAFIEDTLESLLQQTYPGLKILISDDASTDDTAKVCERFAAADRQIRILSSAVKPLGAPKTHLAGEVAADWPWILGLALRGEFLRVPEVLRTETRKLTSVSRSWKRNRLSFAAVALACANQVFRSSLTLREQLRLYREIALTWRTRLDTFSWEDIEASSAACPSDQRFAPH